MEDDLRKLLRRRAGWKVDDDGAGGRYRRRGSTREGLVRRVADVRARDRWHAAVLIDGRAQYTARWESLEAAVGWIEAHR